MGKFSEHLILEHHFEKNVVTWTLIEPLTYETAEGWEIVVPAGFSTDLASVPRIFWAIFPPDWNYSKAAVVHDYLLVSGWHPKPATQIFKEGMIDLGVSKIRISIMVFAATMHFKFKSIINKFKKHESNS